MRKSGKGPNRRGSIYESPKDSGIWWAQLPTGDDGKRPKKRARSEAEAVQKLGELEQERAKGLNLSENPTIAELMRGWLTLMVQPNVSERTYEDRAYFCARYI